jgi:hypothetical protein
MSAPTTTKACPRPRLCEGAITALVAAVAALMGWVPELVRSGFYFHDDMQLQYVPIIRAIGALVSAHGLPLLTNETWAGGAIAGEYQHGALSAPHVLVCLVLHWAKLTPAATALAVTLVYIAFTAAGAFRLGRRLELSMPLATMVALVASLNGFNIIWSSWLPALTGFAWVPWFWWALDRALRPERPWQGHVALALTTYGLLAAGWHFAVLMAALIGLYVFAFERGSRTWLSAAKLALPGLFVGLLLAVPALACLVEYTRGAVRTDYDHVSSVWSVPLAGLTGLLAPRAFATWNIFGTLAPWPNLVLANGVLPFLILPAALCALPAAARRKLLPLLAFALFVLVLALLPSFSRVVPLAAAVPFVARALRGQSGAGRAGGINRESRASDCVFANCLGRAVVAADCRGK